MTGRDRRRRGRPPVCTRELALRVVRLQRQGLSYREIAVALNAEGIRTPFGLPWRKAHVDRLLHTRYAREIIEEQA